MEILVRWCNSVPSSLWLELLAAMLSKMEAFEEAAAHRVRMAAVAELLHKANWSNDLVSTCLIHVAGCTSKSPALNSLQLSTSEKEKQIWLSMRLGKSYHCSDELLLLNTRGFTHKHACHL